jgi:hypothetical protein
MHIDDTAYHYFAAQIAEHPLDPYGFEIFWYSQPQPANQVLAPPVLPYWCSLAIRLFGERVLLWKLWLLPFSLLFVGSLYLLARRFASGLSIPLVIMTVLSPTFLPSLNLMLDIPALSLSLCALALFLAACERGSVALAAGAGLIAGLGMQTKYTAALAPAAMLLYGLIFRRLSYAVIAGGLAAFLFAAWEMVIAARYGESHFLLQVRHNPMELFERLQLAVPLLEILGALTPALGLLALSALGARPKAIAVLGGVVLVGYVLVACLPENLAHLFSWHLGQFSGRVAVSNVVFAASGVGVALATLAAALRLSRLTRAPSWQVANWHRHREEWFLLLWLALEVVGYFLMTPFPAARRTMGATVVITLIGGRLASRTCRARTGRTVLRVVTLGGIVLGLGFYALDLRDAYAQKIAVENAAELLLRQGAGRVWYVGHWGFQYYAERVGMRPVVPGESKLRQGDWLVVPSRFIDQQEIELMNESTELVHILGVEDFVPLRTVPCYYGGDSPVERHDGPRLRVQIYRARLDFTISPKP